MVATLSSSPLSYSDTNCREVRNYQKGKNVHYDNLGKKNKFLMHIYAFDIALF